MKLAMRSEVSTALTWDLSLIYPTEDAMYQDLDRLQQLADAIVSSYHGQLTTPDSINACLDDYREFLRLMSLTRDYCDLAVSVDYYNTHNQERNDRVNSIITDLQSKLSFIDSELSQLDTSVLHTAMEQTTANRSYLENVLRARPYQLQPETERVLAALSQTLWAPYQIYNMTKLADMQFDSFTASGKEYPLGYSLFEDDYEYEKDINIRRNAFQTFSAKLRQYENTTAAAYNTQVQTEKTLSDLRGYKTVFDSLLFPQKVELSLYHRQIDLITEKLAPHMRKYALLLQKIHGLDRMTFADLKIAVDPEYDPKVTIEASKKYIIDGLSILGPEYGDMIREAYRDRWVDFAKNQGKSTGGFCASPYGKNSYILLSWNDRMADVFTLAHELGHAGHFRACNSAQSIFDTDVSSYFVEAPSTMNELLMAHHLLKTNDDKRFRRWVLSCMISNTYYHNFVTHLMEAAYQREVYRIIDKGGSVQAETLSRIMKDTLQKFWGDAVEICDGAELTWMRQPHYYMGLYSYTYSAGLTIATQVCKRIESEGQTAVEDWKRVLAAGSTKSPLELAQMAGIDLTTEAPLLDTIEYIGSIIEEICQLTDELEQEI